MMPLQSSPRELVHDETLGTFIFPGNYTDIGAHRRSPDNRVFDPTADELNRLKDGSDYVVVYGTAVYYDQFGSHWIRYCQLWHNLDPAIVAKNMRLEGGSRWNVNAEGEGENPNEITPYEKKIIQGGPAD